MGCSTVNDKAEHTENWKVKSSFFTSLKNATEDNSHYALIIFVARNEHLKDQFYPFGFHLSTNSGCGNLEESEHGKLIVFTPVEVFKPSL